MVNWNSLEHRVREAMSKYDKKRKERGSNIEQTEDLIVLLDIIIAQETGRGGCINEKDWIKN